MQNLNEPRTHERYLKIKEQLTKEIMEELTLADLSFCLSSEPMYNDQIRILRRDNNGTDSWAAIEVAEIVNNGSRHTSNGTAVVRVWNVFAESVSFRETKHGFNAKTYVAKVIKVMDAAKLRIARNLG